MPRRRRRPQTGRSEAHPATAPRKGRTFACPSGQYLLHRVRKDGAGPDWVSLWQTWEGLGCLLLRHLFPSPEAGLPFSPQQAARWHIANLLRQKHPTRIRPVRNAGPYPAGITPFDLEWS